MTTSASQNAATSFDSMVKTGYQAGSLLRKYVRVKTGVVGSSHVFPKIRKGVATPRIPQADVTPMNLTHEKATATLTDWNAADYSDVYDLATLTFDERKELAESCKMAIGRRMDQMIIDAMAASAYATQVDVNVGGSNTGLNLAKFLRAKRLMDDLGVPASDRAIVCSARAIEQALAETQIGSGDYNILRPLLEGTLTKYAGFTIIMMESRDEGGVPISSTTRNNFAFHKDAVGLAIGLDMRTDIAWVPEKTSTLINAMFKAGAVTIDSDGVIDLLTYES